MRAPIHELPCPAPPAAEPVEGNYFVAAYPPFSAWRQEAVGAVHELLGRALLPSSGGPFGLYAHVPFCAHRCPYCYYLSYAARTHPQLDGYVDAVLRELALYRETPAFAGRRVGFVYFGGGTPSLLPTPSVRRLLAGFQGLFPWDGVSEVTFECAPQSATPEQLAVLRDAGINRLSLGVQQLDDRVLRLNGRIHLCADVERAWAAIRARGFAETNIDLIAGLVGETEASFFDSLERVLTLAPDSVTIYQLEIPLNTPLYRALRNDTLGAALPSWEVKHARVAAAFARLRAAGYAPRSAYAAARNPRHDRFVYQEEQYRGADLLGVGVSSLSYLAGTHFQNHAGLQPYLASLADGVLPLLRAYRLRAEERAVREFVLQLKLGRVEVRHFREKFGVELCERFAGLLAEFARRGWLTWDDDTIALTDRGLPRVDRLLPAFYLPEHQGLRYS